MAEREGLDALTHSAECKVCGERVLLLVAPLHIEEHKQRGEYPAKSPFAVAADLIAARTASLTAERDAALAAVEPGDIPAPPGP